jgi:hypothetical protein
MSTCKIKSMGQLTIDVDLKDRTCEPSGSITVLKANRGDQPHTDFCL